MNEFPPTPPPTPPHSPHSPVQTPPFALPSDDDLDNMLNEVLFTDPPNGLPLADTDPIIPGQPIQINGSTIVFEPFEGPGQGVLGYVAVQRSPPPGPAQDILLGSFSAPSRPFDPMREAGPELSHAGSPSDAGQDILLGSFSAPSLPVDPMREAEPEPSHAGSPSDAAQDVLLGSFSAPSRPFDPMREAEPEPSREGSPSDDVVANMPPNDLPPTYPNPNPDVSDNDHLQAYSTIEDSQSGDPQDTGAPAESSDPECATPRQIKQESQVSIPSSAGEVPVDDFTFLDPTLDLPPGDPVSHQHMAAVQLASAIRHPRSGQPPRNDLPSVGSQDVPDYEGPDISDLRGVSQTFHEIISQSV